MTPEIFSEWLRRQGQIVIRSESSYWHSEGLGVYQAFPYHWRIEPPGKELAELFSARGAAVLRYSLPAASSHGCPSYAIVFEGKSYEIENLGTTRRHVRKGLRECSVEPIPLPRLAEEGWEVRCGSLDRQGRRLHATRDAWRARCLSAADLPGFQAWGARVQGKLAGYIMTFQMGDCFCIIDHQSLSQYLSLKVNNALTFVVSQQGLALPGVATLFYGLESLDAPARVAEFKFHMGYVAQPIRQRVAFAPRFSPLVNGFTHFMCKALVTLAPGNRRLAKAEGLLRVCRADQTASHPNAAMGAART
jgi:hypothetical protein